VGYGWIDGIQTYAKSKISDSDLEAAKFRFPHNPPPTKEAFLIRSIFHEHFPQNSAAACVPGGPSVACSTPTAILWDQSFKQFADCSGRSVLGVHSSAYDQSRRSEVSHATLLSDEKTQQGQKQENSNNDKSHSKTGSKRKETSDTGTPSLETNGDKQKKVKTTE